MTTEHEQQIGQLRVEFRELREEVFAELRTMRENHLAHMQDSLQRLELSGTKTSGDVAWLLKFFWIVAGALLANFIATLTT